MRRWTPQFYQAGLEHARPPTKKNKQNQSLMKTQRIFIYR
ncbi:hypothetical protein BURPS1655_F0027 [Burkholderia pseudomallei 1655]|nr:hypothetical protein BURPS1655_F0027 [Burkholderia pseudomallei 1655]